MKRLKLLKHLHENFCVLIREGGSHSIYINKKTGIKTSVPRHADIDEKTVLKICSQLEIPKI
jgi:predicted RNA binding protein YcfA (HicA-like mRNA interferase family)